MLKLDRLEISGFKSFVDPVELSFAGGITAIVGPNGCGKSNLSDAVTWVLGEQSAKSLRGGRMEDVIFAGSQQRKPLGMAEVTLHLATDPAFPRSDDGHVSIGRRVFRSGESQYRLNGRVVRLKEIKDLLMDTGLGIRAYSVIEQGKVGLILSGKPQERRRLLEEAAGITRYKQRKRLAEIKLEEATANLLRLDDIVAEVERSLRSLKRQASAARRYKQAEEEHRRLLRQVLAGRWARARQKLAALAAELAVAEEAESGLAAELARGEAELAAGRERAEELAAEVGERHQRHAEIGATIEGRQQFLKASRQRLDEIGERAVQARTLAGRRQEEIERQREEIERLAARRGELEEELSAAAGEVDRDEEALRAASARLAEAEERIEDVRRRLLADIGELNGLRNRRHQAQIEREKGAFRRQHLERELAERESEVAKAAEALERARARVAELAAEIAERDGQLAEVAAALEKVLREEQSAVESRRRTAERLTETRHRRTLLSELARAFAERRERLAAALAEVEAEVAGAHSFLADRLSAVAGWERSLDAYLAELEHAVLLPPSSGEPGRGALAVAERLAAGPGATVVEPSAAVPEDLPVVDDPAVVLSLGEALGLSDELAAALPPAFLVEAADDAVRLARRHHGVAFVARSGVWAAGGAVHAPAGEAAPGVLERERELGELEREVPRLEGELAESDRLIERLVARRAALAKESNALQSALAERRQELAVAEARSEDAQARHHRLGVERETVATERDEVERELARRDGDERQLDTALVEAERRHAALEEELERARAAHDEARAHRQGLSEASAGRRGRLDLLRERLEAHDRESERLAAEVAEGERQVEGWAGEGERLAGRRRELEAEIESAEAELQEALERRTDAGEGVVAAQERLDAHRQELRALEASARSVRERLDAAREEVERRRIQQAELRGDAEHAAEAFREHFVSDEGVRGESVGGDPEAAAADRTEGDEELAAGDAVAVPPAPALGLEALGLPAEPPANLAELEVDLARTKAALERLGPVNVLAVEEYAEQEERHGFLTAQRADVVASVESLKRTIREINQTSGERFAATFAEVNVNFGRVFQRLFRGGEAEMRLMDEEDVLESGIEIVARPPGKRLQNIMLMSGGEKALTAIALLFALFQTKPSPFCILDEVDAPLDDVNTLRFAELLREMTGDTQFIVITHNKLTMESAGTLYGVTMEEKGVSKLVSVELDEIEEARRTA